VKLSPLILAAQLLFSFATLRADNAPKPNIIFILADDLGVGNVSCYGADNYKTPNIDRLASGGIRFTHGYTAPLCGPSRALIMTGRYAFRTGATNQDATGRMTTKAETFMPNYLKPAGYVTSCIGKWGQLPLGPAEFGFDDYLKFRGSGVYWNTKKNAERYWVNGVEKKLGDKEYMPHLMHTHLVNFLEKHRDEPFYIYYPMSHVHGELQRTPDSEPNPKDLMVDNVAYMDKLVGKLVAELERLKLREKTLLIFMGDNGTGHQWAKKGTIGGRELIGAKGEMTEGGAHVPLIANWPGVTPAGKVLEDMVDSTDFVPTFAELTGAKLPADKVLDGHSILPQLLGEKAKPRNHIFIELARNWYVREANWKLNEKAELYDMSDSPFTEKLVAASADTEASKAARTRLATALAKLNPAGGILDEGDGTGRHADKSKKAGKKMDKKVAEKPEAKPDSAAAPKSEPTASETKPAANPPKPLAPFDAELAERARKFDRIDFEHKGKITREEYMARQSDPEAASKRFDKFDVNRDGFVTREEYIANGAKKLKAAK
jgi:arylsulfatase A